MADSLLPDIASVAEQAQMSQVKDEIFDILEREAICPDAAVWVLNRITASILAEFAPAGEVVNVLETLSEFVRACRDDPSYERHLTWRQFGDNY